MKAAWWRGRRVFLTGHTGFKGAWLCLLLNRLGAVVQGYSLPPPTDPSLFALARLDRIIATTIGDVRDGAKLSESLNRSGSEIVVHMAAQSLVRESYRDPAGTYAANVMGTVNVLEAARNAGEHLRAVIIVTSDKCYENRETGASYRETEPLGGMDPYSSSKACAELVTGAYRHSFLQNTTKGVASVRAGNVIGGGDWARDRLVPDIIAAFSAGKPVVIRHPDAIRPWQFVLEPLAGYLTLAEKLVDQGQDFAEAWNFGPGEDDARPVRWIVENLARQWGDAAGMELAPGVQPHEAACLKLDAAKAYQRLLWRPRLDLPIALQWLVQWHKDLIRGQDARAITERQIESFLALSAQ